MIKNKKNNKNGGNGKFIAVETNRGKATIIIGGHNLGVPNGATIPCDKLKNIPYGVSIIYNVKPGGMLAEQFGL